MSTSNRRRRLGHAGRHRAWLLVAPVVLLVLIRSVPALDLIFESVTFHLVVVSAIAACASGVAVAAATVAARTRDGALVLLALGCLAVGGLMLAHGLTTPGVHDRPVNEWVGRLPVLAIAAFGACLAIAGWHPAVRRAGAHPLAVLVAGGVLLAAVVGGLIASPTGAHGSSPVPGEDGIRLGLVIATVAVLALAAERHRRRWRLAWDVVQFALALSAVLCACAAVAIEVGTLWHLRWWDYHGYLLAGFAGAVYAIAVQARRQRTVTGALQGAFDADPLAHIAHGYPEALRALVTAVEAKDSHTHGHSARVAELAVRIGVRLGLGPDELRAVASGAYLHDIGKIGIADSVLNKPGPLTPAERTLIEQHPVIGWEIARRHRRWPKPSPSSATTTSGGTATATPTASPPATSPSPPGWWRWPTCGMR